MVSHRSPTRSSLPPDIPPTDLPVGSVSNDQLAQSSSPLVDQDTAPQDFNDSIRHGHHIDRPAPPTLAVGLSSTAAATTPGDMLSGISDSHEFDGSALPAPPVEGETYRRDPDGDDLLERIPSMYRLLDLVYEQSSGHGGLVEKVIIDQSSLGLLSNKMRPGSYQSVSNINFKILDKMAIKPKGLYGSRPEIAKFLKSIQSVNDEIAHLLQTSNGTSSADSNLRPGLYFVLPPDQMSQNAGPYDAYLIFWPEVTTWCDNADSTVRRNRVTFMRYLTQLSDQIVALVSEEQATSFVWHSSVRSARSSSAQGGNDDGDDNDVNESEDEGTGSDTSDSASDNDNYRLRIHAFEVEESNDQEENVSASPGFQIEIPRRLTEGKDVELIGGETAAGLLLSSIEPSKENNDHFDEKWTSFRLKDAFNKQAVVLGGSLTTRQLHLLAENGLKDKYPELFENYDKAIAEEASYHKDEDRAGTEPDNKWFSPIVKVRDKAAELKKQAQEVAYSYVPLIGQPAKSELQSPGAENSSPLWSQLWRNVREAMSQTLSSTSFIVIEHVEAQGKGGLLRIQGVRHRFTPRRTRYRFHPLELTQGDIQRYESDSTHIPRPIIRDAQFEFKLEDGCSIEFIRPTRDKCLVIVASQNTSYIYMADNLEVGRAIASGGCKVCLNHERLGSRPIYAYDELTRVLAVLYGQTASESAISLYVFDETFSRLRSSDVIRLGEHYRESRYRSASIRHICFVTGTAGLCLIDSSGCARLMELDVKDFRPASLDLGTAVYDAFSAPNGACLFVTVNPPDASTTRLRAFHWASFGQTDGFNPIDVDPQSTNTLVTSFASRGWIQLVSMISSTPYKIISTALHISQQSAEFNFRGAGDRLHPTMMATVNNSLIDCHMEVWSQFPVHPAIPRNTHVASIRKPRSITFVSVRGFAQAKRYFTKMVSDFQKNVRKPGGKGLADVCVEWSSTAPATTVKELPSSCFQFGGFVVELLCLIPIHLAITKNDRFFPLKDGLFDPAFEQELLGADLNTIVRSLSIGWYESIFRSYLAAKPVRVVSSMGEQSVGKSYCLNHFADTSFAGSAMRTTEGVWLSCTPTKNYLLVSLDFEGVQSIERSVQEDALLVLFNTAISNLVLFRNNFAISRNMGNMFKSFQASAGILDPKSNPSLFNSKLVVIVKDVIESDSEGVVQEFKQKFQNIAREDGEKNFITRLHRGHVIIISWPLIKSRDFYDTFKGIRSQLHKQHPTYKEGGAFLETLKMLMAKLKTNDWAAIDQNLATLRTQHILELLPDAIRRGGVEQSPGEWGPLKNLDNDLELLDTELASDDVFWLPSTPNDHSEHSQSLAVTLATLIQKCDKRLGASCTMPEAEYVDGLQLQLDQRLGRRIDQVRNWISINVERFPKDNQDVKILEGTFDTMVLEAKAAIRLCKLKCSSCYLPCLRPHEHTNLDNHDCGTSHKCASVCSVEGEHSDSIPCYLPAQHGGRHLCEEGRHTCQENCRLLDRIGCQRVCTKEIDHKDDHLCSSSLHLCGKPCDLQGATQTGENSSYTCSGLCNIQWDHHHERHSCSNAQTCPLRCQLCPRLCCHTDHFHGLNPNEVHVCGQEHTCTQKCEARGNCEVETLPFGINEQFTGRYDTFTYTSYIQVERRFQCAVQIPSGKLHHDGPHTHNTTDGVIHYCQAQCPHCKYYCKLPFGHPQKEHETSHGAMIETRWSMEGPSYELQDHKYGSGDQGSTVYCSLVCMDQGRHVHVDFCDSPNPLECEGKEQQHIHKRILPDPDKPKDWISHRLFWARSRFKDPYSPNDQLQFAKCDSYCPDPEHRAAGAAATSKDMEYCSLPLFHAPQQPDPSMTTGYISKDGHQFGCKNPVDNLQNYHVVFLIDSSISMTASDHKPLPDMPISDRLRARCNNRYGAVLSALYKFLKLRESSQGGPRTSRISRTEAWSVITFHHEATVRVSNDMQITTDTLIDKLISNRDTGATDFTAAITKAKEVIEKNWSSERAPVIVFLSDGEDSIEDHVILDICRGCERKGIPLAFYAVSFGNESYSASLRQMVNIAYGVYAAAQRGGYRPHAKNRCEYSNVLNSIQLANRFWDISKSLQNPRASLIRSSENRRFSSILPDSLAQVGI